MNRFQDRVVIVTGAASGIGRASALRIASEQGTVVCIDINNDGLAETVEMINKAGAGFAEAMQLDVGDSTAIAPVVANVAERHGKLNALCNIAGVLRMTNTLEEDLESWNRILRINLTGTFLMCQAALPHLIATQGSIVNMSSTSAIHAQPWAAAYASSKGAVRSLTKTLAIEFVAQQVNVNCLSPASINTPMTQSARLPADANYKLLKGVTPLADITRGPEDVAALVAFLASDDARHITGVDIPVDGGVCA